MRACLLALTILISFTAFAAKKSQRIPPCTVLLTGHDLMKTRGPALSRITSLLDRYSGLTAGIGWGEGFHRVLLDVSTKTVEPYRNTLPLVPKPDEKARSTFVVSFDGKLKQDGSQEWANRIFKVVTGPKKSGGFIYELSADVERDSAKAHELLYLVALQSVPYADAFELIIQADKWSANSDIFEAVKRSLLEGESQTAIAEQIAPVAVQSLSTSEIFKSKSASILQFDRDKIVQDPDRADAFMIVYRFLLKARPTLN